MSAVDRDRALAAFEGLALGDALGMPTQSMSRTEIAEDYGRITGFVDAGPRQRIARGMAAGSITDDTEQAVLLAHLLIEGGGTIDVNTFARRLLDWERTMEAEGSLDLLGPSTKAALQRLGEGVPASEAGRFGTTNGAAMRIAPVGIAVGVESIPRFVDAVAQTSEVTHNTTLGIASASAVGAAVSAGVAGAGLADALDVAVAAAEVGATRGHWIAGGDIAARLRWAIPYIASLGENARADALSEVIGTSVASQESVVAALAIAAVSEHPWDALCLAAGLGGDTDTIAAIAGAVLGATHGTTVWPARERAALVRVNRLDLPPLVDGLLALRR
ncbi:ADP-ribosylglycohydrolase family protein [Leifsonia sp. NPDC058230]|uniref:ADP-ribosylglycohydrolase family protein n=1 Tax=Leifsonia sp. NPDC058230 TaxID=3346391 RepID=UPI0036DDE927